MVAHLKTLFLVLLLALSANAADIYVDDTLVSDCSGDYSIASRNCTGSDGDAYNTMQDVIWGTDGSNQAMSVGDTVILRGGTYSENWGSGSDPRAAMQIPVSLNGSAWTIGNFNTLKSYDGEWAIIDANDLNRFAIGLGTLSTPTIATSHLAYWKFERLEITEGASGGLAIMGGPVIVRYCKLHNNGHASADDNAAGLFTRVLHDSTVEYNWFINNSGGTGSSNRTHIVIYADYPNPVGVPVSTNIFRYNLFQDGVGGTRIGIKYKSGTAFATDPFDASPTSEEIATYKTEGDKIHHNIFDITVRGIMQRQQYGQTYNNIFDNCKLYTEIGSSNLRPIYMLDWYNNTLIGADTNIQNDLTFGHNFVTYVLQMQTYIVNNIVSGAIGSGEYPMISVATRWDSASGYYCEESGNHNWAETTIDFNFIHSPSDTRHYGNPSSYPRSVCDDYPDTSTFNTERTATNYTNSTAGLFIGGGGANDYITDGAFVIGATTIAAGGSGGAHPYLSGVTFPSYVGATNPDDNDWVDGVLTDLANTTWLRGTADRDGNDDPTWIEGAEEAASTPNITGGTFIGGCVNCP